MVYHVCLLICSLLFGLPKLVKMAGFTIKVIPVIIYYLLPLIALILAIKEKKYAGIIGSIQSLVVICSFIIDGNVTNDIHICLITLILSTFYTLQFYNSK